MMQYDALIHGFRRSLRALVFLVILAGLCQQQAGESMAQEAPPSTSMQGNIFGGMGNYWLSQFANPALRGALYQTPDWPMTGYYPIYPGANLPVLSDDGVRLGPINVHPLMGVAQMYTDNVFRTRAKAGDFFTTISPGMQGQLPFAGRHVFVVDYRTNLQFYQQHSSNNVQDQTGAARFKLDFPGGLKLDLGGEHKIGHDPRGTAVDTRAFGINKWQADSMIGQAVFDGAQSSIRLNLQSTRWRYLHRTGQDIIQNRLTNYAGMTLSRNLSPKTSLLANVGATQQIYEDNKNLDSVVYQFSGGVKWDISELTSGQILVGVQQLRFSRAQIDQPPPVLNRFTRGADSFTNFFVMGNLVWVPTPFLTVILQPYRTVQQTAALTSLFFVSTGANLAVSQQVTDSTTVTLNLGIEQDKFTSASGATTGVDRTDLLKNVAIGAKYRAVKWLGVGVQYIYENRTSTQDAFEYNANTMMVSAETLF
ncbi:MAG: outer membrane beta-barrel protein [Nitrospira sp.]|nr:outer membrane beta-barrel protein [Nitrospira sp.]